MTNGDKIRAMSDSEYADWLCDHLICGDCPVYAKCGKKAANMAELRPGIASIGFWAGSAPRWRKARNESFDSL